MKVKLGPPTEPPRELNLATTAIALEDLIGYDISALGTPAVSCPVFSRDGRLSAVLSGAGDIAIANGSTGEVILQLPRDPQLQYLEFSPRGSFLVSWSRSGGKSAATDDSEEAAKSAKNLRIWSTETGALLESFFQKQYRKGVIQWTEDEAICCRIVSNEVHVLDGRHPEAGIVSKVFQKGCSSFGGNAH